MKSKKIIAIVIMLLLSFVYLKSQVTIGSGIAPEKAALLDLKTHDGGAGGKSSNYGGILLPRVEIDNITNLNIFSGNSDLNTVEQKKRHIGLTVYNINNDYSQNLEEGIYVWSGEKWEKSTVMKRVNFFYMPSIVIPTNNIGPQPEIDLYEEYKKQFETPLVKNPSAPTTIPFFLNRNELNYYITDYDKNVFDENSIIITDDGKLSYTIKNPATNGSSYINIVFVIK